VAWNRHYYRIKGNRHYELTNHLGNVLAVVTDRKLGQDTTVNATYTPQYYLPDIYSVQNYYAFGQNLPQWSSSALNDPKRYRFGFNGKEDEDEWTKQDYGFRMYDPRVARFLSVDPLASEYPWYTPYQFAGDMPIKFVDLDGLEPASPDQYGTSSEGLPILKSSAIDHGDPSHPDNRREVKPQEFTPPPPIAEIKSTPNDRKTDAFSKHNSNVLKTWVADPQALKEGDPLEWASIIPIGKGIKGAKALGKAIKGADELVDAAKGVEKVAEAAETGITQLKPLGLGSTGRTAAKNIVEQLAMKDVMNNPQLGTRLMEGMGDDLWKGWTKMEYKVKTANGINAIVHYVGKWENGVLQAVDDFKFK
jgi:RHS repeat-associated protein